MTRLPLALVLALTLFATQAAATSAVTCHCFKDRTYDPARPEAAEPYVLATARNSLLAAAFGTEKGPLVRKLMGGAAPDDLWIAWWCGWMTGTPADRLLDEKGEKGSWKAALTPSAARLGAPFGRALAAGQPDSSLAALAVDDVLVARLKADEAGLRSLRAGGASSSDAILAVLLAPRAKRPPADLFAEVKSGRKTWGAVLQGLGLTPRDVEPEIRKALR